MTIADLYSEFRIGVEDHLIVNATNEIMRGIDNEVVNSITNHTREATTIVTAPSVGGQVTISHPVIGTYDPIQPMTWHSSFINYTSPVVSPIAKPEQKNASPSLPETIIERQLIDCTAETDKWLHV